LANGAAADAKKESKDLQELIQEERRCEKKAKDKASQKVTTGNKKKPNLKHNGKVESKKRKKVNKTSTAGKIVAIYGHELYRGEDYEKCGSEWFHVKYGNGSRESVNALVVAQEAPGLGADYILDHCMESDEDIKNYAQWYNKMKYASDRAMEV
jgi:hypothetical protein